MIPRLGTFAVNGSHQILVIYSHRPPIEVGCPCYRFRTASCGRGLTDRAEQGQPELLGVVLVAWHRHESEPARLARAVGPGAQQ